MLWALTLTLPQSQLFRVWTFYEGKREEADRPFISNLTIFVIMIGILPRKYILSDITGVAYAYFAFLVMIAVVTWRKYNIKRKKEPFGETNIKKFHGSHFYSKQMLLNDLLYICCKKVCLFWIYIHFLHLYLVVKAIFNWSNQKNWQIQDSRAWFSFLIKLIFQANRIWMALPLMRRFWSVWCFVSRSRHQMFKI